MCTDTNLSPWLHAKLAILVNGCDPATTAATTGALLAPPPPLLDDDEVAAGVDAAAVVVAAAEGAGARVDDAAGRAGACACACVEDAAG